MWPFKTTTLPLPLHQVPDYIVWSVSNFNKWFCRPDNGATYAHAGIYLRTDKLSLGHIEEYLHHCYAVTDTTRIDRAVFLAKIRKDWYFQQCNKEKLKNKSNNKK